MLARLPPERHAANREPRASLRLFHVEHSSQLDLLDLHCRRSQVERLVWLAPVIVMLLGLEYHAIVRWEEQLLESRRGDEYRDYTSRVPRWTPRLFNRRERREENLPDISAVSAVSAVDTGGQTWNATLFSERGTLLAIAAG